MSWTLIFIASALLFTINTKLVSLLRHATRGAMVHRLPPSAWVGSPRLVLLGIRLLMFLLSFLFSNAVFFASQYGPHSCFFSRAGFQGMVVPWWTILLGDSVLCAYLSVTTLPLYSLLVQLHPSEKQAVLVRYLKAKTAKAVEEFALRQQQQQQSVGGGGGSELGRVKSGF
jgi:hypothetical protein